MANGGYDYVPVGNASKCAEHIGFAKGLLNFCLAHYQSTQTFKRIRPDGTKIEVTIHPNRIKIISTGVMCTWPDRLSAIASGREQYFRADRKVLMPGLVVAGTQTKFCGGGYDFRFRLSDQYDPDITNRGVHGNKIGYWVSKDLSKCVSWLPTGFVGINGAVGVLPLTITKDDSVVVHAEPIACCYQGKSFFAVMMDDKKRFDDPNPTDTYRQSSVIRCDFTIANGEITFTKTHEWALPKSRMFIDTEEAQTSFSAFYSDGTGFVFATFDYGDLTSVYLCRFLPNNTGISQTLAYSSTDFLFEAIHQTKDIALSFSPLTGTDREFKAVVDNALLPLPLAMPTNLVDYTALSNGGPVFIDAENNIVVYDDLVPGDPDFGTRIHLYIQYKGGVVIDFNDLPVTDSVTVATTPENDSSGAQMRPRCAFDGRSLVVCCSNYTVMVDIIKEDFNYRKFNYMFDVFYETVGLESVEHNFPLSVTA